MRTRRGLALATLVLAGVAVIATSPRKWNLELAPASGSLSIPAGARSAQQRVELRLVPAAMAGGGNVTFNLLFTSATTVGGHAAHLRARAEPNTGWRDLTVTPTHYGMVTTVTSAPCNGGPCRAGFVLEWVRDEADASAAVPVQWTVQGSASAIGEDPPRGLRLELVNLQ